MSKTSCQYADLWNFVSLLLVNNLTCNKNEYFMTFFFLGRFLKIFDGLDFLEDELSKGLRLPRMNRFLSILKL